MKETELLTLPGKATATSLELPPRLDYDEWRVIGFRLAQLKEFTQWAIGDWLNYGEAQPWGERYTQAAAETGIPEDRLMIYKHVASRVHFLLRNKNLKWSFHLVVAKLEPSQQREWLERTVKKGWQLQDLKDNLVTAGLRKAKVSDEIVPAVDGLGNYYEYTSTAENRVHDCPYCLCQRAVK